MKKIIFIFVIFSSFALGQGIKKFDSLDQLKEAVEIGTASFYEPQYFSGHKNLAPGEELVSFPHPTGVKMQVVGGVFWVLQRPGTKFIGRDKKIIRRWDCGNRISGFFVFKKFQEQEEEKPLPLLDLKTRLQIEKPNKPASSQLPSYPPSLDWEPLGLVGGAVVGGLIGGYGFPKTETSQEIKIIPGIRFQTGDGTFLSTPDKMEVVESTSKKFNWSGAAIGAALGFISSYLVLYF